MNIFKKHTAAPFRRLSKSPFPFFLPHPESDRQRKNHSGHPGKKGKRRVLIVTDAEIRKLGLTKELEKLLTQRHIFYTIYDKTAANPTTANVAQAADQYRRNACNVLIGFGGGSSMDCAKAVGACIANPNKSPAQMKGILRVRKKLPLLIAIPTTAGMEAKQPWLPSSRTL